MYERNSSGGGGGGGVDPQNEMNIFFTFIYTSLRLLRTKETAQEEEEEEWAHKTKLFFLNSNFLGIFV